jgi:hypothetical protein
MERPLSAVDAVADERQQRVVFIGRRAEERADMSVLVQHGSGEHNGVGTRVHDGLQIDHRCVSACGPPDLL